MKNLPLLMCLLLVSMNVASATDDPPADLQSFFQPPPEYAGDFGDFLSPLKFYDGREVTSAEQWPARRREIRQRWDAIIGEWPPLIETPNVEHVATTKRGEITQHQLRLGVALEGETVEGFLLVPPGEGPFPAVLVVYYDAQTGVGLGTPLRDFAWQLAQRGFVTLSIGKPFTGVDLENPKAVPHRSKPYYGPTGRPVALQPLSALGYLAANCQQYLANRNDVDGERIGIVGHSFGGKWAMFASCLHDGFACAVWSDGGIVFDERDRRKENPGGSVNYQDRWYLGYVLGEPAADEARFRSMGLITEPSQRTGSYKVLMENDHDLVELHALMAPRPFLVSGGTADMPERWMALNHAIAVNRLLGYENRVAMTNRDTHGPNEQSNGQIYRFFEWWLKERQ
ncbi:dienelactone hydrolase family protein [Maioricimonas rarisocia]|nr:acyl-CoA thioester hydrolase/BAAT C-terminal domain-containing protein [Maioricimonas rarisocia]